jgi:hypothetical protein
MAGITHGGDELRQGPRAAFGYVLLPHGADGSSKIPHADHHVHIRRLHVLSDSSGDPRTRMHEDFFRENYVLAVRGVHGVDQALPGASHLLSGTLHASTE